MGNDLSIDEMAALEQIGQGLSNGRPSACVARNTKRLTGLKYAQYGKNDVLSITDKGKQTLFIKHCIDGLRALAVHPSADIKSDVATFLLRKGHVAKSETDGRFNLTEKGRECLEGIDAGLPSV